MDNAMNLERKLLSWWTMVNFTYDPVTNEATAFVLTIDNATINVIHPIIAIGLNHGETILYPSEQRAWAQMVDKKWQTVNVESCVTQEQQGFLCESNTTDPQNIGLDTQQGVGHLEINPDIIQKTVLGYLGQSCCFVFKNCLCFSKSREWKQTLAC